MKLTNFVQYHYIKDYLDQLKYGHEIIPLTSINGIAKIIPQHSKRYNYQAVENDTIQINTDSLSSNHQIDFDLIIKQSNPAVSFTLPSNIKWGGH